MSTTADAAGTGPVRPGLQLVDPLQASFINREVSWLDFNARVLEMAEDPTLSVLERAKFLAIFSSNLDEFFQVRVAGLKDQVAAGLAVTDIAGFSAQEQLDIIGERVRSLLARVESTFLDEVVAGLVEAGIVLSDWTGLDDDDREHFVAVFHDRIFPVLTPLAVDPGHPFPHISDLSLNLAVLVRDPVSGERRFARVKIPPLLPRFLVTPDGERFVAIEAIIAAHLANLFPGMDIEAHFAFRVTRNADLTLEEEEADDLLAAVEMELRRRRFRRAVRLELDARATDEVRALLLRELELEEADVYVSTAPLDLGGLWSLYDLDRPDLKQDSWFAVTQPGLLDDDGDPTDLFAVLSAGDVLVHHPYESFTTSVEAFIKQAASDPDVLAIKLTLYRTSGDSPIVKALIRAAERGKQVAVLVELKARFDEQANIVWAKALEDAGVHVVYGIVGLKTHCKIALVVRQESSGVRRYCHVGTGNYNPRTARLYEDIGLLSADPDLGRDLADLFNFLTGYSRQGKYRKVMVAPIDARARIIELIDEQGALGDRGHIVLKMNGLDDRPVIDALYAASRAGTPIDLIVRSICCLRPGVPGLSDTVRVLSGVGRYLEHSRIFAFGRGAQRRLYIASADLRARNLDRRIEVVVPVDDARLRARLEEILSVNIADQDQSWQLRPDGSWVRLASSGWSVQSRLQELAASRSRRDPHAVRP